MPRHCWVTVVLAMIAKVVTRCERQNRVKIEADWLMETLSRLGIAAMGKKRSHHKELPGTDDKRQHIDQHKREQGLLLIRGHDRQQQAHTTRQLEQLHRVQIVTEKACIPGQW